MNWAQKLDAQISTAFPGWAAQRAAARARAAQSNYLATSYTSAQQNIQRRRHATMITSADGQLHGNDIGSIQEWSRDLWNNNPLYRGLFMRAADNIIGTGLVLVPKTEDPGELNKELGEAFAEYTRRGGAWDATRTLSLAEAQRMGFFSVGRDGDFLMYRADAGWQHFEGGQIGTPRGYDTSGPRIIGGVQKDALDRPSYYWVADYAQWGYLDLAQAKGLRADLCSHVRRLEYFSQSRGLPVFQNALSQFEDFYSYLEAELLGAMASACVTMEINSPQANALSALGLKTDATSQQAVQERNKKFTNLAPGQLVHTFTGEKLIQHNSTRPNSNLPEYVRQSLRLFGMQLGMPLEISVMDFSQTNYAAAKMAMNQAVCTMLGWRMVTVEQQVTPVYHDWHDTQTAIKLPRTLKFPRRFEIIEPETGWIDAYKEALAINAGIEGGWETLAHAAKEHMRRELVDIVRDLAEQEKIIDKVAAESGVPAEKLRAYMLGNKGAAQPVNQLTGGAQAVAESVVARLTT